MNNNTEITSLETAMKCAEKILTKDINDDYLNNRTIIDNLFTINESNKLSENKNELNTEIITARLCVIDSLYATQMTKRLYVFQDLSKTILENGGRTDKALRNKLIGYKNYIKNNSSDFENDYNSIAKIFNSHYGIHKTTEDAGLAISLISKYFYFVSNHTFPIYDTLVNDNIFKVLSTIDNDKCKKISSDQKIFINNNDDKKVALLKAIIKNIDEKNFSRFDNLLWLLGKIRKHSFASFIAKDSYITIPSRLLNYDKEIKKAENEDKEKLQEYLEDLKGIQLFSSKQADNEFKRFLDFCLKVLIKQ